MKINTLNILYEDNDIIVCLKPAGLPVQSKAMSAPDMETMLLNHLARSGATPYIAVIHRLDQPVSGILVFGKNSAAAKELNKQLQNGGFGKYYLAETDGCPESPEGTLTDYLVKDGRTNTSRVCQKTSPGAKIARLSYRVVSQASEIPDSRTLLDIHLDTGRHHQIRVQLAHMGCPIAGDTKYNPACAQQKGWQELKLCAYRLSFRHPKTGELMEFKTPFPAP